ncbi:hypothetical protein SeLEV6574_g04411 [Synchytrium endobioticum]|uniref:Zn(2)-C6 fungal-type domain-containing protein n=1 Tax=Synchytrium endobioticum TaxID=286115 RepID=A0A507CZF9_9FUNG|nr:hypothetical protein SeLEV6574_g04411 [Synchytrium endobioticum]
MDAQQLLLIDSTPDLDKGLTPVHTPSPPSPAQLPLPPHQPSPPSPPVTPHADHPDHPDDETVHGTPSMEQDAHGAAKSSSFPPRRNRRDDVSSRACDNCRKGKRKCDGIDPCARCKTKAFECHYTPHNKRRPRERMALDPDSTQRKDPALKHRQSPLQASMMPSTPRPLHTPYPWVHVKQEPVAMCMHNGPESKCTEPSAVQTPLMSQTARPKPVVLACEECRRIKRKCDGIKPTCRRCAQRGSMCTWSKPKRKIVQSLAPNQHAETATEHCHSQYSLPLPLPLSHPPSILPPQLGSRHRARLKSDDNAEDELEEAAGPFDDHLPTNYTDAATTWSRADSCLTAIDEIGGHQNKAGSPSPRPKPVDMACDDCRRSKRKCDGVQLSCGPCVKRQKPCTWSSPKDMASDGNTSNRSGFNPQSLQRQPSPLGGCTNNKSPSPQASGSLPRPRILAACDDCRRRKTKCDGEEPCWFCALRNTSAGAATPTIEHRVRDGIRKNADTSEHTTQERHWSMPRAEAEIPDDHPDYVDQSASTRSDPATPPVVVDTFVPFANAIDTTVECTTIASHNPPDFYTGTGLSIPHPPLDPMSDVYANAAELPNGSFEIAIMNPSMLQ